MKDTKMIRITFRDWNKLRRLIPGRKEETYAKYMNRVVNRVQEVKE